MSAGAVTRPLSCWCGNRELRPYSPEYRACPACDTLVSALGLAPEEIPVKDDDHDFYGKSYWLDQQTHDLGLPDIAKRARTDLPERCMYWLRTLLRHKPPPARVLDVGCAHGGFVALLRSLGYDAVGLELSPWVVEFARRTFGVPVLLGPVEEQDLPERSFDSVVLNDVLEHLADPVGVMGRCARLLKEDGSLVIQTPCYPEGASHADLVARNDLFLKMMSSGLARQHLYLFSRRAVRRLLEGLGLTGVTFLPAVFGHDMYLIAGPRPVDLPGPETTSATLLGTPGGRVCLAWLDLLTDFEARKAEHEVCEADRAARLEKILRLHEIVDQLQDMLRTQEEAHRQALRQAEERRQAEKYQQAPLAAKRGLTGRIVGFVGRRLRGLRRAG